MDDTQFSVFCLAYVKFLLIILLSSGKKRKLSLQILLNAKWNFLCNHTLLGRFLQSLKMCDLVECENI